MSKFIFDRRTPQEKYDYAKKNYDEHWFEEGRTYRYELSHTWYSGWYPNKIMTWGSLIYQCEASWMLIAAEYFNYNTAVPFASTIAKRKANKWGKDYLERRGPPADHWAIRNGPPELP